MNGQHRILRWVVPVDGQPHRIPSGICHVAARTADAVEVWTRPKNAADLVVTVVGTGHGHPGHWQWIGTAPAPHGLVWHLMDTKASPVGVAAPTATPEAQA